MQVSSRSDLWDRYYGQSYIVSSNDPTNPLRDETRPILFRVPKAANVKLRVSFELSCLV